MKFRKKLGSVILASSLLMSSAMPHKSYAKEGKTESKKERSFDTKDNNEIKGVTNSEQNNKTDYNLKNNETQEEQKELENNIETQPIVKNDSAEIKTEKEIKDSVLVEKEDTEIKNDEIQRETTDETDYADFNVKSVNAKRMSDISDVETVNNENRIDLGVIENEVWAEIKADTITVYGNGQLSRGLWFKLRDENNKENLNKKLVFKGNVKLPEDSSMLFLGFNDEILGMENVDTSNVVKMSEIFAVTKIADPDVSNWNTSKVENMASVFNRAEKANPDVSKWDTSKVKTMYKMFADAVSADPDVSRWDTSNVEDMCCLFNGATNVNPDVSNWNTSKVKTLYGMFVKTKKANPDVSKWDTSNVIDMTEVFRESNANPDVSNWDTSKVKSMFKMFAEAQNAEPDVSKWDTSSVENMSNMFFWTKKANPDVSKWDTSSVENMSNMFFWTKKANPDVSKWDTSKVKNMSGMFNGTAIANPDVSKWDTSNVENMSEMFNGAAIANPDVSKWDTGNVTSMKAMFRNAQSAYPDVTKWNVSNVKDMSKMFENCKFRTFDFRNANNINDLSNFIVNNSTPEVLIARGDFFNKIIENNGNKDKESLLADTTHLIYEISKDDANKIIEFEGAFEGRRIDLNNSLLKGSEFDKDKFYKIVTGHKITFEFPDDRRALIEKGNKDIYMDNIYYAEPGTVNMKILPADSKYRIENIISADVKIEGNSFDMPDKDITIKVDFRNNEPMTSLVPAKINIKVKTVWQDLNGNAANPTTENVNVALMLNNAVIDGITLNQANNWNASFEPKPVSEIVGGPSYDYIIQPDEIEGYDLKIEGSAQSGFSVIYKEKKTEKPENDSNKKEEESGSTEGKR